MVKPGKSSASSNTRKKHAKKSNNPDDPQQPQQPEHKKQRGQKLTKAQKKAIPKIKQYIPPPKPPAPPIPDPLDGQGLARSLPAELVVVLRRLGKKDDVTRRKGLEELREGWVSDLVGSKGDETENEMKEIALLAAVPVWMHNLASLLQSPFHRTTALALHNDLLSIPSIQSSILETLSLSLLPGTQNRDILGSWLVSALEEGRRAGGAGIKLWEENTTFISPNPDSEPSTSSSSSKIDLTPQIPVLIEYLSLSILDPANLHEDIHPPAVSMNSGTSSPTPSARVLAKSTKIRPSSLTVPTISTPAPEEEEVEAERWARYRVAGLTGLSWLIQRLSSLSYPLSDELRGLLRNPVLWTALSPLESGGVLDHFPGEGTSLGWQQPAIRRAGYNLLSVMIDSYPEEVEGMLELLSVGVLGSCWLETESIVWESAGSGVIKFLSKYRTCWEIAMQVEGRRETSGEQAEATRGEEEDEDDEDEDENDGSDEDGTEAEESNTQDVAEISTSSALVSTTNSTAFSNLLSFIATICPSIPQLTYPLLLVIASTLPSALLPLSATETTPSAQLSNLFSHLWSPYDAKLLSTHALPNSLSTFQSFLTAAIDVTTYLIGKSSNTEGGQQTGKWLATSQLAERVWKDAILTSGGKARVRPGEEKEKEAVAFGGALERIYGIDESLGNDVLRIVRTSLVETSFAQGSSVLARSLGLLIALRNSTSSQKIHKGIDEIVVEIARGCYKRLAGEEEVNPAFVGTLVEILRTNPNLLGEDFIQNMAQLLVNKVDVLATSLPLSNLVGLFSLVASTASSDSQAQTREAIWRYIDHSNASPAVRLGLSRSILDDGSSILLSDGVLDGISVEATQIALSGERDSILAGDVASSAVVSRFISQDALHTILALVSTSIHDSVTDSLLSSSSNSSSNLEAPLQIFAAYAKDHLKEIVDSEVYSQALVAVFHLVHVLPRVDSSGTAKPAVDIWTMCASLPEESRSGLNQNVSKDLAGLMGSASCRVDPGLLLDAASASQINAAALLPSTSDLLEQMTRSTTQSPHPSLPITDTLIPYSESYSPQATRTNDFDALGRSTLARYISAILIMLRTDRKLATEQPDLLRVVLSGLTLARDAISVPGPSRGLYAPTADPELLKEVVRDAEGILSYTLSYYDELPLSWHNTTIQQLKAPSAGNKDFLQALLSDLKTQILESRGDVESRVFRDVLGRVMRQSGGEKEGEAWLAYAMTLVEKAPQLALAIILAIKPLIQDSKTFSTAQNRLASALTTIPTRQIASSGIHYLRLLTATAPPSDAASLFIPQQRAIFVLKHIGGWLVDDDDSGMSEDVEWRVLELYGCLAGIVQDLPGGHWDSIFDLVENGLEASSLEDVTTHCLLYHSLLVLQQIRDLAASNKSLKASWTSKEVHMGLVLKLFLQCRNADSLPLQMIQTLLLDLLPDIPEAIKAKASSKELCDLLKLSKSSAIQCAAYRVLNQVIRQNTLALVLQVEASVAEAEDGHAAVPIELPAELLGIVEGGRAVVWEASSVDFILGQLLSWLAILDHFEDASTSLRWAYLDQLTSGKLLNESLLPMLFAMFGVSEMGAWNFPASQYAVDEFYPDLLLPEDVSDLVPLASHVFYRALVTIPSAMRTYYESLKDRQLSLSLLTFTTKHYSPIIISHELSTLRQPTAMAQLTEEGLNVKIISGGGGITSVGSGGAEAIASYVVDEQPMEIGIRLPAEFPLRGVDVRDLRRVGVPENKWRGWLMSVQQTITSRNGLIMEALTVFKRNVSLHFEGVVECAICYSIISLTDRTLPTKPCRTCKNRFHASCLFKWFNSSHSSSCPLCRALF